MLKERNTIFFFFFNLYDMKPYINQKNERSKQGGERERIKECLNFQIVEVSNIRALNGLKTHFTPRHSTQLNHFKLQFQKAKD